MKDYKKLYDFALKSGLLWEYVPACSGSWSDDEDVFKVYVDKIYANQKINFKEQKEEIIIL